MADNNIIDFPEKSAIRSIEKPSISNLITFPGGGRKTEADILLHEFVEVTLINDDERQYREFNNLSQAIFSYVRNMERGSNQS